MVNLDKYIVEFVGQNWITLGLVYGLAKSLAVESKNNIDNKIVTWFGNALRGVKSGEDLMPSAGAPGPAPTPTGTQPSGTGGAP